MLKAWLAAAVFLTTAGMSSAATVSVEITETGIARLYNCATLTCLSTGVGDGTVFDPENEEVDNTHSFLDYSSTVRFTVPEAAFQSNYFSEPFGDQEHGYRWLSYSGNADIVLTVFDTVFAMSGPIQFSINELWPAYINRIYMTGALSGLFDLPFGTVRLMYSGERSISYVATPPAYTGVPELDLPFQNFGSNLYISGNGYDIRFSPATFNVKIDVEEVAPVPLPASGLMLALGLAGLTVYRRRKS